MVFTLPKMLRVYFKFDRGLLNGLSRAAWVTVLTYLKGLLGETSVPGMIIARQTFGERARFHPHLHALLTDGGWDPDGEWERILGWDRPVLRKLFEAEVFRFLRRRDLLLRIPVMSTTQSSRCRPPVPDHVVRSVRSMPTTLL